MTANAIQPKIRLAEVVASLTLATDLATGQPLEHGLRRTLLAVWLGEALRLSEQEMSTVYYVALLGAVGCVLDGAALAGYLGDEIEARSEMATLDLSGAVQGAAYFIRRAGAGDPPWRRLKKVVALSTQSMAVCRDVALHVGAVLDLGPSIREALGQCDEHWNGKSGVLGLKGEQISLAARLFLLAQDVDVFNRVGGVDAAVAVVRERSGKYYDPRLAACFGEVGPQLLAMLQSEPAWDAVLAAEPAPLRLLSPSEFDVVALKVANFVDMRSPFTVGHSPRVALLAEAAARELGLAASDATAMRQAGLLHDLGRAGVPVATWHKSEPLSASEWDRMRQHPSLTEVLLARSASLGHLGTMAGLHHERLDGSGYRAVSAASLPVTARILAVADAYQTRLEPRPHREAMTPEAAAKDMGRHADAARLDGDVVRAVLAVAGHEAAPKKAAVPAGLSERELEVLRLAVQGLSNRQIAEALFIAPKTAGHHIESIYNKTGVSTRVGATLFAIEHGLTQDAS